MSWRDTYTTRSVLRLTMEDLRKRVPGIKPSKALMTAQSYDRHQQGRRYFYFEYRCFRWEGEAWDTFEARAKAWDAYMQHLDKLAPAEE